MPERTHTRIRLSGGPDHSVTWVDMREDGSLVIEYYDHSPQAHDACGNDVAYFLTIAARDADRALDLLQSDAHTSSAQSGQSRLLEAIGKRFTSYFDLLRWLEANGIPLRKTFDPWA